MTLIHIDDDPMRDPWNMNNLARQEMSRADFSIARQRAQARAAFDLMHRVNEHMREAFGGSVINFTPDRTAAIHDGDRVALTNARTARQTKDTLDRLNPGETLTIDFGAYYGAIPNVELNAGDTLEIVMPPLGQGPMHYVVRRAGPYRPLPDAEIERARAAATLASPKDKPAFPAPSPRPVKPAPEGLGRVLALHRPVTTDHLEMRERDARATTWER